MKNKEYQNGVGTPAVSLLPGNLPTTDGFERATGAIGTAPGHTIGSPIQEMIRMIMVHPRTGAEAASSAIAAYEASDRGNAAARRHMRQSLQQRRAALAARLQRLGNALGHIPLWADKPGLHTKWLAWFVFAIATWLVFVDWANAAGWVQSWTQGVLKSFLYTVPIPIIVLGTKVLIDKASSRWQPRMQAVLNALFAASGLAYVYTLAVNFGGGGDTENLAALIAGKDLRAQMVSQLLVGVSGATLLFLWWQRLAAGISTTTLDPRRKVLLNEMTQLEGQLQRVDDELARLAREDAEYVSGRAKCVANAEAETRQDAWQRRFLAGLASGLQIEAGARDNHNGNGSVSGSKQDRVRKLRVKGLCAAVALIALVTAGAQGESLSPLSDFVMGLSPFYATKAACDATKERVMFFLLRDTPAGSSVSIYDGWNVTEIARFEIPVLRFDTIDARAKAMRTGLLRLERWFEAADKVHRPADPMLIGALKTPDFLEFVARLPKAGPRTILLLGSPFCICEADPKMTMTDRRFPSDTLLLADSPTCCYGAGDKLGALVGVTIQQCYPGEGIWHGDKAYQKYVTSVWAKYSHLLGATWTQMTGDAPTFFANVAKSLGEPVAPTALDLKQPLAMLSLSNGPVGSEQLIITPVVRAEVTNWVHGVRQKAPSLRSEQRRPVKLTEALEQVREDELAIGVLWKHPADLDLWVWAGEGADPLCYLDGHRSSREGWYNFDHREATASREVGDLEDSEFVVLNAGCYSLPTVRAWVNFYGGTATGSRTEGEVIIRYRGKNYHSRFVIEATTGNQGKDVMDRTSSPYWTEIKIQDIVKAS